MKTAIIGLGNIGSKVAANLAAGGESIIVGERDMAKAEALAARLGDKVLAMPVEEAVDAADLIVLAIYFDAIKQFLVDHRAGIEGKILVDPSNPIAPDGKGGFKKIIPADQSAGQIIAGLVPEGSELVKAFGTLVAQSLESGANRSPERAVLFYATDYPESGRAVARLITASGFDPVSVGHIDQSIRIEVFGDLHEAGKLGRLVSAEEARLLV
jgi:predicted dinucleotide-binding enzyme